MEAAVTGRRRTTTHAEEEEAEEEEEEDDEEEEEEDALVTANPAIAQHPAIAPFRYLINEQAKSFVVLQELQNEVGALLEFRDLVMETFPHLRQKSVAGGPRLTAGAPTKQRDWEPGVRVKRKLHQLHSRELQQQDISLAAPPRSRSNSHGKAKSSSSDAAANSGTSSAGSSAVQDSGFCADSSKEHCSTSAASSASSAPMRKDADDELWNLLDMIHVKGTRLRLQVEHLQQKLDKHERVSPPHAPGFRRRSRSLELISTAKADHPHLHPPPPHHPPHCCPRLSPLESEMRALRQERDMLLDRIADMEAENLANVARSDRLLAELSAEKRHLQRQLRAAAANSSHRQLLVEQQQQQQNANRYHSNDIGVTPLSPDYLKQEDGYRIADTQDGFRIPQRLSSTNEEDNFRITERLSSTNDKDGFHISQRLSSTNNDGYRIRPTDPVSQRLLSDTPSSPRSGSSVHRTGGRRLKVGALDGIVSSPSPRMKGARDVTPDKKKTAAILAEFNAVELQRHLLVTTFQNQIANSRIERLSRSYVDINHQLEKFKEENDDLRFQLEEKSIELEGTRARIRLLERLQSAKFAAAVDSSGGETLSNTLLHPSNESTPNPILPQIAIPAAAVAATAEEAANAHHSSSTESAHHDDVEEESCGGAADVEEGKRKEGGSPKKRPAPPPSKIPLKSYTAPKPPAVSRTPAKVATPPHSHRSNEKLSLGGVGSGGSRSKSRDSQPAQQPRSRDRTTSPATGRESLRRPRKLSAQEASFSSTGSSHSTPRTPHSYSSLKKARGAASAAASAASEGGGGEHKKTTQVVAKPEPERLEKTEEFVDSLDNGSGNQELDRSMSSVAPSRNWRHSPQSRLFFDSIDNTNNNLNQSLCLSAREAMADSDSLEPSCSDLV